MNLRQANLTVAAFAAAFLCVAPAHAGKGKVGEKVSSVSAKKVYTGTGKVLEGGVVSISDGKISSVSGGGSEEVFAITPGLVDLGARAGAILWSVEQSDEVTARLSNSEALDPWGLEWDRLVKSGVTTVLATPLDQNVVGGLSQVVKTAGADSIAARTAPWASSPASATRPPSAARPTSTPVVRRRAWASSGSGAARSTRPRWARTRAASARRWPRP
jgi:imidazolonepropionase-like amidohydrolase